MTMTNTVLTTIALYDEWKNYCKEHGLPWKSADELFHSEDIDLTAVQRSYIFGFIQRWEEAQRAEDRAERGLLQPNITIYRGLEIEGVCYRPAATEKELEDYRRQLKLDVERRNRKLSLRDIGITLTPA